MSEPTPHITAAELRIMKILWRIGSGTVRRVLDELIAEGPDKPAYTTVMTMLKQLGEKRALSVDRQRRPFIYTPAADRDEVLRDRVSQFLKNVFDGQAGELVLRLVEEAELSAEDIRRIEAKIQKREAADGKRSSGRRRSKGDQR